MEKTNWYSSWRIYWKSDELKIAKITLMKSTEDENKCISSCTIYVILIVIVFTICIGIGTYFIYYKHMDHDKEKLPLNMIMSTKHQIININGKYQRNKH